MAQKKALITGITGQDGSYLAELLLEKGYEVHGIIRRSSTFSTGRIDHIYEKLNLHYGDLADSSNLSRVIEKIQPNEIYNLAAQSHVKVSFEMPEYTADVDGVGVVRLLDAIKDTHIKTRLYQASSSEMYGGLEGSAPQNEKTPFYPRSPYAAAKVYGFWICVNYREAYDMFVSNGILFNHESPRRGRTFVTRKITAAIANILAKKQNKLVLGNLDAKRDWGFAKDYVEAMWMMLQHSKPDDFVVAMGETHTVREFCELAFHEVGIDIEWKGEGVNEVGFDKNTGIEYIGIDEKYFRPTEVDLLHGDPTKAMKELGWKPRFSFQDLVKHMIEEDCRKAGINL